MYLPEPRKGLQNGLYRQSLEVIRGRAKSTSCRYNREQIDFGAEEDKIKNCCEI
jgi:hypothetical protein